MSWDDDTFLRQEVPVYYTDHTCYYQVGKLEHYSSLKRYDTTNSNGEEKSKWGMSQQSKMLPAAANSFSGEKHHSDSWVNQKTIQTQNWQRTDVPNLENIDYSPSTNKTTSYSGSFSVSIPPGLSVGASADHPNIDRSINYDPDAKVKGTYQYTGYFGGDLASRDQNVLLGQSTGWITDRPSSGDDIAPSYFYGRFHGEVCDYDPDGSTQEVLDTTNETLFTMFQEGEINDI